MTTLLNWQTLKYLNFCRKLASSSYPGAIFCRNKEEKCFMHWAWNTQKNIAIPTKPITIFASNKSCAGRTRSYKLHKKGFEWNNAAYEIKREKSYYFTYPLQDTINSYPHFNQRKRMETWEKHQKQETKTEKKLK